MFTSDAQTVIDKAKDVAISWGESQLTLRAIMTSLGMDRQGLRFLSQCLNVDAEKLRQHFPQPDPLQPCPAKLALSDAVREMLARARDLVAKMPPPNHPSLVALPHLAIAAVESLPAEQLHGITVPNESQLLALLANWVEEATQPPSLGDLTRRLRALRAELLRRV